MRRAMTTPDVTVDRWQRSLLPGGMVTGSETRRSARDWAIDVLVTVVSALAGIVLIAIQHYDDARWMLDAALGVATIVALWWRRRHPAVIARRPRSSRSCRRSPAPPRSSRSSARRCAPRAPA